MQETYSDDQLILAARLYFMEGLPQAQIGKLAGVSQSKVSRMLALARQRGLVRVTVPEYEPRNLALEHRILERLGIESLVIRAASGSKTSDLRQVMGYFAAPIITGWIRPASKVAVSGGRTMQSLIESMKPSGRFQGVTVLQAMGNIDSSPGPYDAVELGRQLAKISSGTFLTLNTPAILPDPETCKRLLALDQIQAVMESLAKADVAFVGIGTLENSVFVERKALGLREIESLREAGAVGEILGRFFDASGRECTSPLRDRVVSLGLEELRSIPNVVAVVSGTDRSEAILAAIRGGLVKMLVIDEGGASAVLENS
ncbi:MAG TPA: sugar-binding domain-containing protein [Bryobacteraceae bacterium]|nr:sugar-binding domain-containing protein [Bryobacteraceae bacterium]